MSRSIYKHRTEDTADIMALRIIGLAKVGAAATDSKMNIDLTGFGYCELFEAIAALGHELSEAIDILETEARK